MSTKLILPGRIVEPTALEPGLSQFIDVHVVREQAVDVRVRGGLVEEHVLEDAADTDVVELEYENGVKQWVSVAQLTQDLAEGVGQRAVVAPGEVRVPLAPSFQQRTRGVFGWVLKGLKVLKIDPAKTVASATAQAIVENFESKLDPGPGLYRLADPKSSIEQITSAGAADGGLPALVFIHGTVSSTAGSFGELAGTQQWTTLRHQYGQRIFGFQHRTLSVNPVHNAIELARLLPAGAKLHLVSHSRGGLVGELLCIKPLTDLDLKPFRDGGRDADAHQVKELSDLLVQKSFRIERFVRVACPARGTILASGRLDRYLSLLLNVIGLIPALKESSIYDFLKATLLELAKRRTEPSEVPGIEAQMPESLLINLLNRPGVASQADLAVIAGDIEGGGIWGHLKVFATDLFYREDHDLVVNTEAMYGGMGRERGAYYFFDQGADVNHFSYFRNDRTRERMLSWLTQPDGDGKDPNFKKITREALPPLVITRSRAAAADLPVLFLLPGIMGSHLKDKAGRVWLDFGALTVGGGLTRLEFTDTGIEPDGIVAMSYERLSRHLQGQYDVMPFPYDWRLSVEAEAARLAKAVKAELSRHSRPIRFLAHSVGGLVVRMMIAQEPELWDKVCSQTGRLVMLGTPNRGSYVIPRLLFRVHPTLRMLALADFRTSEEQLAAIVSRYPGVLEMLPENNDPDFFDHAWWKSQASASAPDAGDLKNVKKLRAALENAVDPAHMIYVAGSARKTPSGIILDGKGRVEWSTTPLGDGTVPYALGLLKNVTTYYMNAEHGNLANFLPGFAAVTELLESGSTQKLDREPPARARGEEITEVIRDDEPLLFPTEEELFASALGADITKPAVDQLPPLQITVAHGNLRQAQYPLAIGHYDRDTIVSAEEDLDRQLGRRLSRRFQMDLYPGTAGSVEIVLAPECSPPGALIIGLGEIGEITPEKVRSGVTEAALKYTLTLAEEPCKSPPETWRSAAMSVLLIGTKGGNALSVLASVSSITHGVLEANRVLREQKLWEQVRIDALEFIEIYEDIAAEALRAARTLGSRLPAALVAQQGIDAASYLRVLEGGQFQRPTNQYATGWWRRILVTGERDKTGEPTGDLKFAVLTDRARAEETLSATQAKLTDKFVEGAIHSAAYNAEAASTLFQLLIPRALRERAGGQAQNLVLVLDDESARYPWELLSDRTAKGVEPLSVQMGLIRQFRTADFEKAPRQPRGNNALVIGDTESGHSELPGAQREAGQVAQILTAGGYVVRARIRHKDPVDAATLVTDLFAQDYKVLHLAGHGIYDSAYPKRSGMVLGDGIFLTAGEIQKLRAIPDLVFLNCCHLGHLDRKLSVNAPHKLAASIAEELIKLGVRGIVAAGWAVDDAAATTFAAEFYTEMLAGQTFGTAVHTARQKTYEQHGMTNTWGAYQCYGNPDFKLEEQAGVAPQYSEEESFSRGEYLARLRNIIASAKNAKRDEQSATWAREALEMIAHSLPVPWRDGELLTAIADAWAELGQFDNAIENYRAAIHQQESRAPIRAIEQLANLEVRYAISLLAAGEEPAAATVSETAGTTPSDPEQLMKDAAELVEWLLKLNETPERLSLLGGIYKRRALLASGKARHSMLTEARDAYRRAHSLALKTTGALDPYPALNWATYRFLLNDSNKSDLAGVIADIQKEAAAKAKMDRSFWTRVGVPDALLLEHLVKGDLPDHITKVKNAYAKTIAGGATEREQASVREHLQFLQAIIAKPDGRKTKILTALKELETAVTSNSTGGSAL